jgi:hypothetical protein
MQRRSNPSPAAPASVAAAQRPAEKTRWDAAIRRSELGVCLVLTAYIVVCHIVLLRHIGALWRDEVQSVNLSLSPTFSDFWSDLRIDTFPVLWPALVRCWSWLSGDSDSGLRLLGLLIGLALVAAVWWSAWQVKRGFPLWSLVLFALSPTVIRYGDTLRGYGLGLIGQFVMYAAIWRVIREPGAKRIAIGLLAALFAVHCTYFNAVILLSLGAASAATSVRRRTWKPVLAVAGIGITAAISLLPYADPLSRQAEYSEIIKYRINFPWIAEKFADALNTSGRFMVWIWLALFVVSAAACACNLVRRRDRMDDAGFDAGIYAGVSMVTGVAGFIAFIFSARQPTNIWYYMPLMALLAMGFDIACESSVLALRAGRIVRLAAVVVLAAVICPAAWETAKTRITNVDLIAGVLTQQAGKQDLIVVVPWWPGITFTRYYHGTTPWTTLPDLGPLRMQRYDIFKQRMEEAEPIRPVLERVAATLRSGHRVWIVGGLPPLGPDELPGNVPPLPKSPPIPRELLNESPYLNVWERQLTYVLLHHAQRYGVVPVDSPAAANGNTKEGIAWFNAMQNFIWFSEKQNLIWFDGWH